MCITSFESFSFCPQPDTKRRRVGGLPCYEPDYDGDEITTLQRINEMRSNGPTPHLMQLTFAARRHAVMQNASIARMKKEYPGLFVEEKASCFIVHLRLQH